MIKFPQITRTALLGGAAVFAAMALAAAPASCKPNNYIEKVTGVWVEGPGFNVTYGSNYDNCAAKCLSNNRCVMIEYYRPERKCNLYDTMRKQKRGGSSYVGIRRSRLFGKSASSQY